jgi:endo-1,4-beta-xylanase
MRKLALSVFVASMFLSLVSQAQPTLKDKYKKYFPIGAAVSPRVLKSADSTLIITHFNSLVCENQMKPALVQPTEGVFTFNDADFVVNFAQRHKMKLRGHTLLWHSQTPQWFFKEGDNPVSKEVLKERLRKHIQTVVSRYKGKVYCWDVCNEVISDKDDEYLRSTSPWFKALGEEFLEVAFKAAREADPKALLFYNDYDSEKPVKRDKIVRLVKSLKDKGVPVDGIGMQGHWRIGSPTKQEIETAIDMFSALGVTVQLTELDVSVYESKEQKDPITMTPEMDQKLADYYKMCFEVFREKKKKISGITFWGVADNFTWLDNYPVRGRKDFPLLFDTKREPKKAFYEVVNF